MYAQQWPFIYVLSSAVPFEQIWSGFSRDANRAAMPRILDSATRAPGHTFRTECRTFLGLDAALSQVVLASTSVIFFSFRRAKKEKRMRRSFAVTLDTHSRSRGLHRSHTTVLGHFSNSNALILTSIIELAGVRRADKACSCSIPLRSFVIVRNNIKRLPTNLVRRQAS